MALGVTTVGRDNEATGQDFLIFTDGSTRRIQTFASVDENGAHSGIAGTPFVVGVEGDVTIDSSTPVNVTIVGASGTPFVYDTAGTAEASAVLTASAGKLAHLRVILDPVVVNVRYLMLFDLTSLPANGTAPDWRGIVPPAGEMAESFPNDADLDFATNGIVAAISTTPDTLTISGAEAYFHARGLG